MWDKGNRWEERTTPTSLHVLLGTELNLLNMVCHVLDVIRWPSSEVHTLIITGEDCSS